MSSEVTGLYEFQARLSSAMTEPHSMKDALETPH